MNEPSFQDYTKTLKSFYIKIMKGHSNMLKLSRNFMQMIEDLSKADNTLKQSQISRKKSQVSISGVSNTSRGIKSLRNISNAKSAKNQYIFSNSDIRKVVLYAYLHHIITISNSEVFNIIETKSKLLIESVSEAKITDKNAWERSVGQWKRVMQLMNHKARVRWEKMMSIAIIELDSDFLDVVLRSIVQASANLHTIFSNFSKNIQPLSALLKITIVYQEIDKGQCLNKVQAGDLKHQLKIGYLINQNIYAYYDKLLLDKNEKVQESQKDEIKKDMNFLSVGARTTQALKLASQSPGSPATSKNDSQSKFRKDFDDKSEKSLSETSKKRPSLPTSLIKKKNLRVIEALMKQYGSNTQKLLSLELFEQEESKDAKIKKIIQSRKKIQQ